MKFDKIARILALALTVFMLMFTLTGCYATAEDGTTSSAGGYSMIIMMVVMIAVFYFFLIRPENKKKKAAEEMRSSLSVGDQITTIGGVVGRIVMVKSETIIIETSEDRVRMEFTKWAVSTKGKQTEEQK